MGAKKGEILNSSLEPENAIDKFAVAREKEGETVGHLSKVKSGRLGKTISYFIRPDHRNACQVQVREKKLT